eukprot:5053362-Prorocentrum_lima.AAC.1
MAAAFAALTSGEVLALTERSSSRLRHRRQVLDLGAGGATTGVRIDGQITLIVDWRAGWQLE